MKTPKNNNKSGAILVVVMVILVSFTLFVAALMQLGSFNAQETEQQVREAQSFWLAEMGVQQALLQLSNEEDGDVAETSAPNFDSDSGRSGTHEVIPDGSGFLSIGRLTAAGGVVTTNRIRFETEAIDPSYNDAISAPTLTGDPWVFLLGGSGDPERSSGFPSIPGPGDTERGGSDEVHGNITTGDGNVYLSGESYVTNSIYDDLEKEFDGDVSVSDGTITTVAGAMIYGDRNLNVDARDGPNLVGMNYPGTADYNLTQIFDNEGITDGRLGATHPLYDLVRRSGDDYYFEPTGSSSRETLDLGDDKVYYAEGDIWFDKSGPLQFDIDGTATIVASGDLHIGDGLRYIDGSDEEGADLLALVALGKYNEVTGELESGGDIYFGDARYGTVYEMDAFMFAANDFYYNFEYNPYGPQPPSEPDTGFIVFGNFVALNQIHIHRDWYNVMTTDLQGRPIIDEARPAVYNVIDDRLEDAITRDPLTEAQINGGTRYRDDGQWKTDPGLRHYRMIVKYDERIHDPDTQPPDLPRRGGGEGSGGELTRWEHYDDES